LKFAVFISAGIGNAIFLLPLIKSLNKKGSVTAIYTSPFESEKIFDGFEDDHFSSHIDLRGDINFIKTSIFNFGKFDMVYLDYFSCNRKNIIASSLIASEIHCFQIPKQLPDFFKRKISIHQLIIGAHEGLQNLGLHQNIGADFDLNSNSFRSTPKTIKARNLNNYITIQPGAGNNLTPWKIWELNKWIKLLEKISVTFPRLNIVILGDVFDKDITHYLTAANKNAISLIDQTGLEELPYIISKSLIHIGGDSGLMHVAGAVETKTITIVGGSDPQIFGWHKIDDSIHKIIQHKLSCHPCYRHYLPNQSRTSDPKNCPDFKCIKGISVDEVFRVLSDLMPPDLA
jgi:hypothetical protein